MVIFCKVLTAILIGFGFICCLFETVLTYSGVKILSAGYELLVLFLSGPSRIVAKSKGKVNHLSENTFIVC